MSESERPSTFLRRLLARWRGGAGNAGNAANTANTANTANSVSAAHAAPAAPRQRSAVGPPSRGVPPGLANFVLKMPKAELAADLVGSLRPASLLSLARKYNLEPPAPDEPGIRRWFRYRHAAQHARVEVVLRRLLREPEDFHILTLDFLAEQAIQNVIYSEAHLDVAACLSRGIEPSGLRQALEEAAREGERRLGVRLRFIADVDRGAGPRAFEETLEWAAAGDGVAALALAGEPTDGDDAKELDRLLEAAKERGLGRVVRPAGDGGPEAVRRALDLAPDRLVDAVRAAEDEALVADLAHRQTPVTVGLSAAVARGAAPDFARHPFDRLYRGGVALSITTRGAQLFATHLPRENLGLYGAFGYGPTELAGLALAAVRHAFLPEEERHRLEDSFRDGFNAAGERLLGKPVLPALPGRLGEI